MPIIKSAKKRVKTATKATIRNAKTRRSLKGAVKSFYKNLDDNKKKASTALASAQSELARAGKKRVIHKNKVARKQKQLAQAAKLANVKATALKKTVVEKAPVKKTPTKKPVTKKVAVKKTVKKSK
jgi:small subunit ribosomal protein S20